MAVRNSTFEIAALDAEKQAPDAEENVAELQHGNGVFSLWRRPAPGQLAMMQLRMSRQNSAEQYRALDRFFGAIVLTPEEAVADDRADADGVKYADRIANGERVVGMDFFWQLWEQDDIETSTLVAMMREVVEIHSGFPTSSPRGSSRSPKQSGPRSTATSRRVKSTPSN